MARKVERRCLRSRSWPRCPRFIGHASINSAQYYLLSAPQKYHSDPYRFSQRDRFEPPLPAFPAWANIYRYAACTNFASVSLAYIFHPLYKTMQRPIVRFLPYFSRRCSKSFTFLTWQSKTHIQTAIQLYSLIHQLDFTALTLWAPTMH